jgi:ribosome biogenesis GTPase A
MSWRKAVSWFPGHMAQATKTMSERLATVDVVAEVRDARVSGTRLQPHR